MTDNCCVELLENGEKVLHPHHGKSGIYWFNASPYVGQKLIVNGVNYEIQSVTLNLDECRFVANLERSQPVAETAKENHRQQLGRKSRN